MYLELLIKIAVAIAALNDSDSARLPHNESVKNLPHLTSSRSYPNGPIFWLPHINFHKAIVYFSIVSAAVDTTDPAAEEQCCIK